MIIFSFGDQLERVPKGRQKKFYCTKCEKTVTFYESKVDNRLQIYFVIDLFKKTRRVMQCGECLGVCDFYALFPEEKAAEEKAEALRKQQEAEAELKKKQQEEEERRKQEEAENKKREEQRRQRDAQVDDELAKLKRQLGK